MTWGIASDSRRIGALINSYVVDVHFARELQMHEVLELERRYRFLVSRVVNGNKVSLTRHPEV